MTIQIEEGKFYKRADGSVHGPAERKNSNKNLYPWMLRNYGDAERWAFYTNAGTFYNDQSNALDLVAEVSMPTSDQHAAETVEGKPDVEDDGFITRDTPEWAAAVESEAAEEKLTLEVGKFYRTRTGHKIGPMRRDAQGLWCWTTANGDSDQSILPADIVGEWVSRDEYVAIDAALPDIKTIIADEAKRIVSGARRSAYGKPEANFERIARFWQAYFENTGRGDVKIIAADVSPLMRLMKEARLAESPNHYDSLVDLIGYTLTGAEVNKVQKPA